MYKTRQIESILEAKRLYSDSDKALLTITGTQRAFALRHCFDMALYLDSAIVLAVCDLTPGSLARQRP